MADIEFIDWNNYTDRNGSAKTLDWEDIKPLQTTLYYMLAIREALLERYIVISSRLIDESNSEHPEPAGYPTMPSILLDLYNTINELTIDSKFYTFKYIFDLFDSLLERLCDENIFIEPFEEEDIVDDEFGSLYPYWNTNNIYWTFENLKDSLDEPWIDTETLTALTPRKILQYYLVINKLTLTYHTIRHALWGYPYYEDDDLIIRTALDSVDAPYHFDTWQEAVDYAVNNTVANNIVNHWPPYRFMTVKDQLSVKYINVTSEPYTFCVLRAIKDKYNKFTAKFRYIGHDQLIMNPYNADFNFNRQITVYPTFYKNIYNSYLIPDKFSFIADTPIYLYTEETFNPFSEGPAIPEPTQIADPFYSWDYNGDSYGTSITYIKIADYAVADGFKFVEPFTEATLDLTVT